MKDGTHLSNPMRAGAASDNPAVGLANMEKAIFNTCPQPHGRSADEVTEGLRHYVP
jgi:hypothetical protein